MSIEGKFISSDAVTCTWCGEEIPSMLEHRMVCFIWHNSTHRHCYHLECWTHANINHAPWMPGDFKRGTNERKAK